MKSEVQKFYASIRDKINSELDKEDIQKVPRGSRVSVSCPTHGDNVLGLVAKVDERRVAVFCLDCLQDNEDTFPALIVNNRPVAYLELTEPKTETEEDLPDKIFEVGIRSGQDVWVSVDGGVIKATDVGCKVRDDGQVVTSTKVFVKAKTSKEAQAIAGRSVLRSPYDGEGHDPIRALPLLVKAFDQEPVVASLWCCDYVEAKPKEFTLEEGS
jgi:exosome complex RNA-binding protein Csl4